jgi:hypothetical protein
MQSPTYSAAQLSSFPWLVSSATLRSEDLALSWSAAAEELLALQGQELSSRLSAEDLELITIAQSSAAEELSSAQLQELSDLVNETLFDLLNELAPLGFSFSSHCGDGALFGFWLCEELCEELESVGLDSEDPSHSAQLLQELDALGADLEQLSDAFQGAAEGYTEEQAGADYALLLYQETQSAAAEPQDWPLRHIDWGAAWEELKGDGYCLVRIAPAVFSVWRF